MRSKTKNAHLCSVVVYTEDVVGEERRGVAGVDSSYRDTGRRKSRLPGQQRHRHWIRVDQCKQHLLLSPATDCAEVEFGLVLMRYHLQTAH